MRPRKLFRWQFSIRMLLVCVAVIGVACAWFGAKLHQAQVQRGAVERLTAKGFTIIYDYQLGPDDFPNMADSPYPQWMRRILGEDFFHSVAAVYSDAVNKAGPDDDDFASITAFSKIRLIAVPYGTFHDSALAKLATLKHLDQLNFVGCKGITDDGLAFIGKCGQLKMVALNGTHVTDVGMGFIANLDGLDELSLCDTPVSDIGFGKLRSLTHLRTLRLVGTKVTDKGMPIIATVSSLEDLSLRRNEITDNGLEYLAQLLNLRQLDLSKTKITDAAVPHLKKMKQLSTLYVGDTSITKAGANELSAGLPNTSVDPTFGSIPSPSSAQGVRGD